MLKRFYDNNKFYSWLLGGIIFAIIIADIAIIHFTDNPNYSLIGKIWVIASSALTAIYTIWFWYSDKAKGIDILDKIKDEEPKKKTKTISRIWIAVSILAIIVIINGITFNSNNAIFHLISIILMILTFSLFTLIDNLIIKNHGDPEVKRDFKYALNNSDIPGVISFSFLAIYFLFLHKYPMDLFFSGAIAFQMLFSSIVWANTEVTDVEKKQNE